MILSGGLRKLEVFVKEGYWKDGRKWLKIEQELQEGDVGEGSNWIALKRVLGDPDLEVARLGTFESCKTDMVGDDVKGVVYRDFG